ncbi:hypothetical protein ACFYWP_16025 [Actinacidiphila glaucinigra]|uniref:hypothetical protein n=1 Tax=Actinacidiphila glaucinigra TaxID=235986 RepID=UPI0036798956
MKRARTPDCSPWEDPGRIALVARLAAKGDVTELAGHLLSAADCEGHAAVSRLRAMPRERRVALARLLVDRADAPGSTPDRYERVMVLLAAVSRGFVHDAWCGGWHDMLEGIARRSYWFNCGDEMPVVAEALLDAGRPLSAEVVGMIRRCAHHGLGWAGLLLDRLPEPPLNPGEPWSDRVLAELPELGDPWRRLIPHLRAAGPRPGARWDRAAAAVIDGVGSETVRRTATPWLALATHGGSAEAGAHDPWNVTAVRGLAWLLSSPIVPLHPDTVRVLGALVERPPVKTVVAAAGIRALARLDGGAGRDELRRLDGCVDHTVTRRQIRRALTP